MNDSSAWSRLDASASVSFLLLALSSTDGNDPVLLLERGIHLVQNLVEQIAHTAVAGEEALERADLAGDVEAVFAACREPFVEKLGHLAEMKRSAVHRE